ncbi:MAG: ACT domain-containing protein [Lachnospiraceae bacterium]|jgi:hypothetical protein|nr:ACT domain-containing protein [Lachnospiraceae bacterium]
MSVKQISVFLENKPGTLKKMTGFLAAHEIDIRAISVSETVGFGVARLIVDDALSAINTLNENDFIANLTPVLAIEVPDAAGGLDGLLAVFSELEVNIEYMYAFSSSRTMDRAYMIFRVADTKAAEAKLKSKGIRILSQEDIAKM